MAKKAAVSKKKSSVVAESMPAAAPQVASKSAVRKTVTPRNTAAKAEASPPGVVPTITHSMIAERAYHIYRSGSGGSEYDNWCRAEAELKKENGLI